MKYCLAKENAAATALQTCGGICKRLDPNWLNMEKLHPSGWLATQNMPERKEGWKNVVLRASKFDPKHGFRSFSSICLPAVKH